MFGPFFEGQTFVFEWESAIAEHVSNRFTESGNVEVIKCIFRHDLEKMRYKLKTSIERNFVIMTNLLEEIGGWRMLRRWITWSNWLQLFPRLYVLLLRHDYMIHMYIVYYISRHNGFSCSKKNFQRCVKIPLSNMIAENKARHYFGNILFKSYHFQIHIFSINLKNVIL